MKALILASTCSFLIVVGQVLWKIAIDKNGGLINGDHTIAQNILNLIFSPYMLSGFFIYMLATIFWIYLLGKYQYSYIYPMLSMTFIISFLFAVFLFNESISTYKIIGVLLITIGVLFIARGGIS